MLSTATRKFATSGILSQNATRLFVASNNTSLSALAIVATRNASTVISAEAYANKPKPQRPISPHVTIYKFPLNALTSITHRVTGCGLIGITYGIGLLAAVDPSLAVNTVSVVASLPLVATAAKLAVAFPFTYHYLAGFRHIVWDMTGEFFELETVNRLSKALIASSAAISLFFVFL